MLEYIFIPFKIIDHEVNMPTIKVSTYDEVKLIAEVFRRDGWDMPDRIMVSETVTSLIKLDGSKADA